MVVVHAGYPAVHLDSLTQNHKIQAVVVVSRFQAPLPDCAKVTCNIPLENVATFYPLVEPALAPACQECTFNVLDRNIASGLDGSAASSKLRSGGPAATYADMFKHNVDKIVAGMKPAGKS